jgi:hypothetical protein
LCHPFASGVDVRTYFLTLLMKSANGCSSAVGQYRDHSSYMWRPSSTASCAPMTFASLSSITESNSVVGRAPDPV